MVTRSRCSFRNIWVGFARRQNWTKIILLRGSSVKIALMGTRGVPASYSGFETCVEQLGQRLVQRGHDVTVYCRSHHITYAEPTYKGMHLVKLPTIANKYLDTMVHSFISSLHALPGRY